MWKRMNNWLFVLPPSRPDETYLENIRTYIRDFDRNEAVAVLGSTPEFRDLLYEMGFNQVYILEKNKEFYSITNTMRAYKDVSNESLILGDWIDLLPNYNSFFNVILSDLTMGNIHYEKRSVFYKLLLNALNCNGLFIDKVLFHDDFLKTTDLIDKYSKKPINLITANEFNCEAFFCSDILKFQKIVDTNYLYEFYGNLDNPNIKQILKLMENITPLDCVWYYGEIWDNLKKDYIAYSEDASIAFCYNEAPSSPYYGHLKYYFVKRKEKSNE